MNSKNGFLLVELVTAIALLSLTIAITFSVLLTSTEKILSLHNAITAKNAALNQLEILAQTPFDNLKITKNRPITFSSPLSACLKDFNGTYIIQYFNNDGTLKKIEITVQWKEKFASRKMKFTSLVSKREK